MYPSGISGVVVDTAAITDERSPVLDENLIRVPEGHWHSSRWRALVVEDLSQPVKLVILSAKIGD